MPVKESAIDEKKIKEIQDKFEKTYGKLQTSEGRKKFADEIEKISVAEFNKIKEFNEDNPGVLRFLNDFEIYFHKDMEGNIVRFKKPRELQKDFDKAYKTVLKRHKDYEERMKEQNSEVKNDSIKGPEISRVGATKLIENKQTDLVRRNYQEPRKVDNQRMEKINSSVSGASESSEQTSNISSSVVPLFAAIIVFFIIVGIFWKWIKK